VTWDVSAELAVVLNDGTNSYIYGPGGLPVEQIKGEGASAIVYLHHDEQGSTRLLTNEEGKEVGAETYDAYGNVIGATGATSPLGYDGQYTEADTGLIYLRARYYDPATAQFLSVDPAALVTQAPYTYARDTPVSQSDMTGECATATAAATQTIVPCLKHIEKTIGNFSIQTSSTPTVTWGFELTAKFKEALADKGFFIVQADYSSDAFVNGKFVNGPGPKSSPGGLYTYHGSIGPKIYGNTSLKMGDLVALEATIEGYAENPVNKEKYTFQALATAHCRVT
jgi:RHS repeat-associated protein